MIVDGKTIRDDIKKKLEERAHALGRRPRLALVYAGEDPVIDSYIALKQKFGYEIGVDVEVKRYIQDMNEDDLKAEVKAFAEDRTTDAIVIQLPLPAHIHAQDILNLVPLEKDADVLSETAFKASMLQETKVLPPVVASVREIFTREDIILTGKKIVVIGKGKLVGKPVALWLLSQGYPPTILDKGDDVKMEVAGADVVISGAGSPHLITPDMVKDGAVLIDAGTSDVGGKNVGDIDPACADKASVAALVPGGVGPITIAKLFENVVTLAEHSHL